MNKETIEDAREEARRFIKYANQALNRLEHDTMARISGSRETAACRRASMDLTRALADMRRAR